LEIKTTDKKAIQHVFPSDEERKKWYYFIEVATKTNPENSESNSEHELASSPSREFPFADARATHDSQERTKYVSYSGV
jgi:hypothetical protein